MHILDSKKIFKMTLNEKIANAKKRINELESLIEYWDGSSKKEKHSPISNAK